MRRASDCSFSLDRVADSLSLVSFLSRVLQCRYSPSHDGVTESRRGHCCDRLMCEYLGQSG
ncbi:MAG: hypothetical protein WCG61_00390 [Chlorobium sp.]